MNGQPPTTTPVPGAAPVPQPAVAVAAPQTATGPTTPTPMTEWPEGDLPEQTGQGGYTALPPAIYTFKLPLTMAQLWKDGTYKEFRKTLPNGQPNPTFGQQVPFSMLKFDKANPLVVEGGPEHGQPMTATFNTIRMPRGFGRAREEATTPWIHDLAYILEVCLGDKSRPGPIEDLKAALNRHAGGLIQLTIGRKGECRVTQVRYIPQARVDPATGAAIPFDQGFDTVPDPSGQKGCGKKYWSKDYADQDNPASIQCDPNKVDKSGRRGCGAMIRGFEHVEGFLPPLAEAPTA